MGHWERRAERAAGRGLASMIKWLLIIGIPLMFLLWPVLALAPHANSGPDSHWTPGHVVWAIVLEIGWLALLGCGLAWRMGFAESAARIKPFFAAEPKLAYEGNRGRPAPSASGETGSGFTLDDAHEIARQAHDGRLDPARVDYMAEIEGIAAGVADFDPDVRIAALIYKAVEDGRYTIDNLRSRGVSERSLAAISALSSTCRPEVDDMAAVRAIARNRDAALVKISEIVYRERSERGQAEAESSDWTLDKNEHETMRRALWLAVGHRDLQLIFDRCAVPTVVVQSASEPSVTEPADTDGTRGTVDAATLSQLADLHDRGILTDAEFAATKAKVLGVD